MIRKILGAVLLVVGGLIGLILLTYGGPVWPHLVGPMMLTATGAILLASRKIAGFFRSQHHG
jgi:hypothetical protein